MEIAFANKCREPLNSRHLLFGATLGRITDQPHSDLSKLSREQCMFEQDFQPYTAEHQSATDLHALAPVSP